MGDAKATAWLTLAALTLVASSALHWAGLPAGFLLGALSSGEAIRAEMRKNFQDLGFLIRRGSTSRLIIELNQDNPAGLAADRAEQERVFDAAVAAKELSAWNEVLRFEMEKETKLRALEATVQAKRADLAQQRDPFGGR